VKAVLASLGRAQERAAWIKRVSEKQHAAARAWLGTSDPGAAVWLAGKEAAFLASFVLVAWSLDDALFGLAAGIAAFFVPDLLARGFYERRQEKIRRELPDVLDLLTLALEAGMSLDAALMQVSEKYGGGIVSGGIDRMLGEVRFGARRHQAWKDMAERLGNPEVTEVVGALVQADTMGVGLAQALAGLARQMRARRRQRIEEEAHKAPVKMLFPLVLFIFPAIFVVLFGPVVLQLLEVLG
jgi:tight adherence protein C